MNSKIVVVIPALNEEETIGRVIDSLKDYVSEVVLVNDASTDKTAVIAREHGAIVVTNTKNLGYDKSIETGFRHALEHGAGIIVTFDADGQHLANNIPVMIDPILKGEADLVVGKRPYHARISEYLFAFVAKLKAGIDDPLCGLKAYRSDIYRKVGHFDCRSSIGTELMFTAHRRGYRIVQRPIHLNRRKDVPRFGRSLMANYKIMKAIVKTLPL